MLYNFFPEQAWNRGNGIFKTLLLNHLGINFLLILLKTIIKLKICLRSTVLFLAKKIKLWIRASSLKRMEKKNQFLNQRNNLFLISRSEKKRILSKEVEQKTIQKKNIESRLKFEDTKKILLKKYRKFFRKFLSVSLNTSKKVIVWNCIRQTKKMEKEFLFVVKNYKNNLTILKISKKVNIKIFEKVEYKKKDPTFEIIRFLRK